MALPFIPGQRYVAPRTGGGYEVVGPGGTIGYPDLGSAEAGYNSAYPATAPPGSGASNPTGAQTAAAIAQMQAEAQLARLDRLDIPEFNWRRDTVFPEEMRFRRDQLGQQHDQFGRQLNQQNDQFGRNLFFEEQRQRAAERQFDDDLGYRNRTFDTDFGLRNRLGDASIANTNLQTRGQIGLGGLGLASSEAAQRMQIGLGAANNLAQLQIQRAQLFGGPENAFKQQAALLGTGANGDPNLAGVLSGETPAGGYRAPMGPVSPRVVGDGGSDAMLRQYAQVGLNPYGGASGSTALEMAAPNARYAMPNSPLANVAGSGQRWIDAWNQSGQGGTPSPENIALMRAAVPGLSEADALALQSEGHEAAKAGRPWGAQDWDQRIGQRLSQSSVAALDAPIGAVERLNQGYQNIGLTQGRQPTVDEINELYYHAGDASPQAARAAGAYYAATQGVPIPSGPQAGNVVANPANPSPVYGPRSASASRYVAPGAGDGTPEQFQQTQVMRAAQGGLNAGFAPQGAPVQAQSATPSPMGPGIQGIVDQARRVTGGLNPNQVNYRNFMRAPRSTQQFALGAFEAQGHDKGDVLDTIGRTRPRAVGFGRGRFAAPAA